VRDAVNDLYDHGADLVAAATALRRSAADRAAGAAAPAVIGCVETALRELREATKELERASSSAEREHDTSSASRRRARMRHGFANLEVALDDGVSAAAAARSLASRALDVGSGPDGRRARGAAR
jgi:hypothetical protein